MQPLHVGFTSDKGGNTIKVTWFTRKQALHHVSLLKKKTEISISQSLFATLATS